MKNDQLNEFYSKHFISKMPSDTEIVPISRIIGSKRLVDDDTGAIAQNVGRLEGPLATICSLGRPVRAKHGLWTQLRKSWSAIRARSSRRIGGKPAAKQRTISWGRFRCQRYG
jgi:hypothetical protein